MIVADDEKRGDFVDKIEHAKLWELMGTFWPNSPRYSDRRAQVAYWYAMAPYSFADCRAAIVRHSRQKGSFWPDVDRIVGGLTPTDEDVVGDAGEDHAEDVTDENGWSFEDTRRTIGYWARLREMTVPKFETAEEYWAWCDQVRESMRGVEGAAPYTEREEHVIETEGHEIGGRKELSE